MQTLPVTADSATETGGAALQPSRGMGSWARRKSVRPTGVGAEFPVTPASAEPVFGVRDSIRGMRAPGKQLRWEDGGIVGGGAAAKGLGLRRSLATVPGCGVALCFTVFGQGSGSTCSDFISHITSTV
jgi:hypothetical protein